MPRDAICSSRSGPKVAHAIQSRNPRPCPAVDAQSVTSARRSMPAGNWQPANANEPKKAGAAPRRTAGILVRRNMTSSPLVALFDQIIGSLMRRFTCALFALCVPTALGFLTTACTTEPTDGDPDKPEIPDPQKGRQGPP